MSEQLRASVYVDNPFLTKEVQVDGEIPCLVASDPGAVIIQIGAACVAFSNRSALIALLQSATP